LAVQGEAALAVVRAEELAEEAAVDAEAWEEMARDHRRWDKDMATARRAREIHELASQPAPPSPKPGSPPGQPCPPDRRRGLKHCRRRLGRQRHVGDCKLRTVVRR
jgi:hypothetical protein